MKAGIFIAVGLAAVGAALWFWKFKKDDVKVSLPQKENERHHLTNIFSKAKQVAIGN